MTSRRAAAILQPPARILVVRLDRIGDVVLSTPVLDELRRRFPHAFIAALVRPACEDLVAGHPAVNEVILYDKEGAQRAPWATVEFARRLRRYEFDAAVVLHPTSRSHWIPWLAKIPVRIGYDRKSGWLLSHRMRHRKHEGARHEAEYTLGLLRPFGINARRPRPSLPVSAEAASRVAAMLERGGVSPGDRLIAVHPSASCVSKRWMPERFAEVADRLIAERGVKVCIVGGVGPGDESQAAAMAAAMRRPFLNLTARLTIAELTALFQRCALLVSNDSGPVHIAAAVGTPVVDIFGRNQRGLSPRRWGPLGDGHVILHKEVGCVTCLAHECDIEFLCLTSLSADEVYQSAVRVLDRQKNASAVSENTEEGLRGLEKQ
jgi:heptosyltransferase-2